MPFIVIIHNLYLTISSSVCWAAMFLSLARSRPAYAVLWVGKVFDIIVKLCKWTDWCFFIEFGLARQLIRASFSENIKIRSGDWAGYIASTQLVLDWPKMPKQSRLECVIVRLNTHSAQTIQRLLHLLPNSDLALLLFSIAIWKRQDITSI